MLEVETEFCDFSLFLSVSPFALEARVLPEQKIPCTSF